MNDPAPPPPEPARPSPASPAETDVAAAVPAGKMAEPGPGPAGHARNGAAQDPVLARVQARARDKRIGISLLGVSFAVGLAISYWAKLASRPETSEPPGPPTTAGVGGWPARVDVTKTLSVARGITRRPLLRGFSADGVRSDGTIDLSEGPGRARYAFQSPPGHGPQPPTPAGTLPRHPYCGRQDVHLRREGLVADPDRASVPCSTRATEPLPDPQCTMADIWKHAIERGVPADRLARIEYFRAQGGPAWRFEQPELGERFVLYGDCRRELRGSAAVGHVP